jgi:hypothetical protein
VLRRFALGRLDRGTTDQVGQHVRHCDARYEIVVTVPDDRLLFLLRRRVSVVSDSARWRAECGKTNSSVFVFGSASKRNDVCEGQ